MKEEKGEEKNKSLPLLKNIKIHFLSKLGHVYQSTHLYLNLFLYHLSMVSEFVFANDKGNINIFDQMY